METIMNNTTSTPDREIVETRIFDAPRKLVFKVWTEAEHIAKWWGPDGFTNTIHIMDVRPGGIWNLTMHGPDGTGYINKMIYTKIINQELIVYKHDATLENEAGEFETTVIFEEQGNKTKLTMRMVFNSKAERDLVVEKYGAVEGLSQNLRRLNEYLSKI
ncbi:MAG: SRPBCC family protein [Ignavibacteriaceae bacterium]